MARYCSTYCKKFNECDKLGILTYMTVLPIHPSKMDKDWCESFEEEKELHSQ